jgi:hypothetical protein
VLWLFPERKKLRATVVLEQLLGAPHIYEGVLCFTCGHAGAALRKVVGKIREVLCVGPGQELDPGDTWWDAARIARTWPRYYDATPGHLGPWEMARLAALVRSVVVLPEAFGPIDVPSGSGETYVALCMAFPMARFRAVYVAENPALRYDGRAPLNDVVRALSLRAGVEPLMVATLEEIRHAGEGPDIIDVPRHHPTTPPAAPVVGGRSAR